ncbi:hypothetical protein AAG570_014001 [Ranatra chinensis]|uniref:CDP-diacylglycerol--glycerol-3-phosphate 3-phosphatidyltransferase n=1 Tax=Ranatra chinensis TaxID=642074 RepID=A0ABD0YDV0_9HEMI
MSFSHPFHFLLELIPFFLGWILGFNCLSFWLQVFVINHPNEFYNALLDKCKSSKKRIALASLYLGTGPLETKLVETLDSRLGQINGLKVNILLDANRGSRGKLNSRRMLLPLLQNYPQCQVSLFHTPTLRGPLRYLLPARYNELVGLQHMKLYLFDDTVIISGANLSEDYFTNRQDRYLVVSDCKDLADFYWGLIERVSGVSLALDASNNLTPRSHHPYKTSKRDYVLKAKEKIWGYYKAYLDRNVNFNNNKENHDTWIFPLVELPPLGVHQESKVTAKIIRSFPAGSELTLSTGYFNITQQYSDTLLYKSLAKCKILMAHPTANGFLKAGGLASGIPEAYTGLAHRFLLGVLGSGQAGRVTMHEWSRPRWTYHAKGLWATPPLHRYPLLTLIGSSNFGARSVWRDLETGIAVVTANSQLQKQLYSEEKALTNDTSPFTLDVVSQPQRKPPLWVLTTMWLFKTFF